MLESSDTVVHLSVRGDTGSVSVFAGWEPRPSDAVKWEKAKGEKSCSKGFEEDGKAVSFLPFLPHWESGKLSLETEKEGTSKNIHLVLYEPGFGET